MFAPVTIFNGTIEGDRQGIHLCMYEPDAQGVDHSGCRILFFDELTGTEEEMATQVQEFLATTMQVNVVCSEENCFEISG